LSDPTATLGALGVKSGDSLSIATGGDSLFTSSLASQPTSTSKPPSAVPQAYRRRIPDDNSCLFSAVAYACAPAQPAPASELRSMVAAAVLSDERWDEGCLGMKPQVYADKMAGSKAWGGEIELVILSEMIGVRIWVSNVETGKVFKYEPEAHLDADIIILLYSGIHYDTFAVNTPSKNVDFSKVTPAEHEKAFAAVKHTQSRTRFQDNDPLIAELEPLTKMLLRAHEYTSTEKFTLRCETCKAGLQGTKEAQAHLAETGHNHFQEYQ
jgi:ubiquitin thioesterase OTU1